MNYDDPHPFVEGQRYRLLEGCKSLRDEFSAGEELVFEMEAHSVYDGQTGYFSSETRGGGVASSTCRTTRRTPTTRSSSACR